MPIRFAASLTFAFVFSSGVTTADELKLAWEYGTPKSIPMAVVADGNGRPFLYAALKNGGLAVLDVSRRRAVPRRVATVGKDRFEQMDVTNLVQHGRNLFLSLGGHFSGPGTKHFGLAIVSMAKPAAPRILSVWKFQAETSGRRRGRDRWQTCLRRSDVRGHRGVRCVQPRSHPSPHHVSARCAFSPQKPGTGPASQFTRPGDSGQSAVRCERCGWAARARHSKPQPNPKRSAVTSTSS